jgi:hypothetical protein
MKIKIIEDGNLASWVRLLLIVAGIGLAVIALEFDVPSWVAKTLLLTGFGIGLVGGMTSRAALLKSRSTTAIRRHARATKRRTSSKTSPETTNPAVIGFVVCSAVQAGVMTSLPCSPCTLTRYLGSNPARSSHRPARVNCVGSDV